MTLKVLKEIEKIYADYQQYIQALNIATSDLDRADLTLMAAERLQVLDRLILMADIFPKQPKCYLDCSLKDQHECNI